VNRNTVLIADDHILVAEGLQRVVEREFSCVGIVSDGHAAVEAISRLSPDVVLLDISMPDIDGIEVARRIREISHARICIVSMMAAADYVNEALAAGVSGYISKECAGTELIAAIREILNGEVYVKIGHSVHAMPPARPRSDTCATVTLRQREVLERVIKGLPAKVIAHQLSISPKTVEFHKKTMMRALSVRNTAELIGFAIEHGLVETRLPAAGTASAHH
jgi:DNA-binding NarL/FixJ family response regulator